MSLEVTNTRWFTAYWGIVLIELSLPGQMKWRNDQPLHKPLHRIAVNFRKQPLTF